MEKKENNFLCYKLRKIGRKWGANTWEPVCEGWPVWIHFFPWQGNGAFHWEKRGGIILR